MIFLSYLLVLFQLVLSAEVPKIMLVPRDYDVENTSRVVYLGRKMLWGVISDSRVFTNPIFSEGTTLNGKRKDDSIPVEVGNILQYTPGFGAPVVAIVEEFVPLAFGKPSGDIGSCTCEPRKVECKDMGGITVTLKMDEYGVIEIGGDKGAVSLYDGNDKKRFILTDFGFVKSSLQAWLGDSFRIEPKSGSAPIKIPIVRLEASPMKGLQEKESVQSKKRKRDDAGEKDTSISQQSPPLLDMKGESGSILAVRSSTDVDKIELSCTKGVIVVISGGKLVKMVADPDAFVNNGEKEAFGGLIGTLHTVDTVFGKRTEYPSSRGDKIIGIMFEEPKIASIMFAEVYRKLSENPEAKSHSTIVK